MLVSFSSCFLLVITGRVDLRVVRGIKGLAHGNLAILTVVLEADRALGALNSALGSRAGVEVVEVVEEVGNLAGLGVAAVDGAGLLGGQGEADIAVAVLVGRGGEDVVGVEVKVLDIPGEAGGGVGGGSGGGGSEGQGSSGAGEVDHFE